MAEAISPATVSAFTFSMDSDSGYGAEPRTATGAIIGTNPAAMTASMGLVSTSTTRPTRPRFGSLISALSMPPSMPESPMDLPPRALIEATNDLFTSPDSTAITISRLGSSVTRRPSENFGLTPWRAIHSVMILPPPWTTTCRTPRCWRATTSWRVVSWPPKVLPPIFTRIVPPASGSSPTEGSSSDACILCCGPSSPLSCSPPAICALESIIRPAGYSPGATIIKCCRPS